MLFSQLVHEETTAELQENQLKQLAEKKREKRVPLFHTQPTGWSKRYINRGMVVVNVQMMHPSGTVKAAIRRGQISAWLVRDHTLNTTICITYFNFL